MSLRRKTYRALIAVWEGLVTAWYMVIIACLAVMILFLVAFTFAMAFDLVDKVVGP